MALANRFAHVLAAALLVTACSSAPEVPDRPPVQQAEVSRVEIRDQSFTGFTAVSHVQIDTQQAVQATQARYELVVDGEPAGSGTLPLSQAIPAGGGMVEVPVTASYGKGEKLAQVLESQQPLAIVMKGAVETSDGTWWEFQRAARVRAPRVPEVKVWHVEAGAFPDENRVGLVFFVRVENRNPFDIQIEQMTYDLSINGKRMIEEGTAGRKEKVPAASVAQLEIPLDLSEQNFPDVKNAIRRGGGLDYTLDGIVRLAIGRIPVELSGPIELGKGAPDGT
ncbi:LEA type 2 family protein [Vulgatibacter sp.]|uniref:LEA type 2 family protein n=1 Tax=Vulgatibacter sp. TaxID=1971226 RepID=UPI0035679EF5